ncbi:uncharacterized protein E0L32_008290 [Thyridium curvatum]|uniref:Uncharacterized protein n=1 Tax=Thyridium curvatum TaxID=1093900 RepID=A0A507B0S1_9PEZI|nr:uncharacterized protein E0L32_008290 [Thyridium curvatum]TPX10721.1 hypothetical protein E0L32_008290 [Thyridium curvatum]
MASLFGRRPSTRRAPPVVLVAAATPSTSTLSSTTFWHDDEDAVVGVYASLLDHPHQQPAPQPAQHLQSSASDGSRSAADLSHQQQQQQQQQQQRDWSRRRAGSLGSAGVFSLALRHASSGTGGSLGRSGSWSGRLSGEGRPVRKLVKEPSGSARPSFSVEISETHARAPAGDGGGRQRWVDERRGGGGGAEELGKEKKAGVVRRKMSRLREMYRTGGGGGGGGGSGSGDAAERG